MTGRVGLAGPRTNERIGSKRLDRVLSANPAKNAGQAAHSGARRRALVTAHASAPERAPIRGHPAPLPIRSGALTRDSQSGIVPCSAHPRLSDEGRRPVPRLRIIAVAAEEYEAEA